MNRRPKSLRVLLVTGSSGGHVTPALAIAEALKDGPQDVHTTFVGPRGGVAERMVNGIDGEFRTLEVEPIRGAGAARALRGLVSLPAGALRSLRMLRNVRPDIVVGTGAHTSGPLLALAAYTGIPALAFEANVEVGLATRWLAPRVRTVAVAWPQTAEALPPSCIYTGWPVGRELVDSAHSERSAPGEGACLLVLGGSAGAPELDRAMKASLPHLAQLSSPLRVIHQASPGETPGLRTAYAAEGIEARVEPFFDDVTSCYLDASLVISRAGGATLSELAAMQRPSILVPLPAAGHHQMANARAWEEAGCGRILPPDELTGEGLANIVIDVISSPDHLRRMGEAAGRLHRPHAAQQIADWCRGAVQVR